MSYKILLVDDEAEVLGAAKHKLELAGYEVSVAQDGVEALKILQHEDMDLIVSDIVMPSTNGLSLCQELKNSNRTSQIPVIVATGFNEYSDDLRGLGIRHFLFKPFDSEMMLEKIRLVLNVERRPLRRYKFLIHTAAPDLFKEMAKHAASCGWDLEAEIDPSLEAVAVKAEQSSYNVVLINIFQDRNATLEVIQRLAALPLPQRPVVLTYSDFSLEPATEKYQNDDRYHRSLEPFIKECLACGATYYVDKLTATTFLLILHEYC